MGKKRVLVTYGVDVDAVAGWLGSYGGEDSTSDISRGMLLKSSLYYNRHLILTYVYLNRRLGSHRGNPASTQVLR